MPRKACHAFIGNPPWLTMSSLYPVPHGAVFLIHFTDHGEGADRMEGSGGQSGFGGTNLVVEAVSDFVCNGPNVRVLPEGGDLTAISSIERNGSAQPAGEMAPKVVRAGPLSVLSLTGSAGTCPFAGHSANKGCSQRDCCAELTSQMSSRGLAGGDASRVTRCRPNKSNEQVD